MAMSCRYGGRECTGCMNCRGGYQESSEGGWEPNNDAWLDFADEETLARLAEREREQLKQIRSILKQGVSV